MEKSLTGKQKIILSTIRDLRSKIGKPPTLEEIRKALGYSGISSVQRHISALKKKGFLSSERYQARSLELSFPKQSISIPLVGNVAAGTPILAIENIEAYIPYEPSRLKFNSNDYFFLRAVGDSMNQSRIDGKNVEDGDYVLIKKQSVADRGQIVVALLGDEAIIKKFDRGNDCYILRPESSNLANKPIYVFDDLVIQGIAVDVLKKGGGKYG